MLLVVLNGGGIQSFMCTFHILKMHLKNGMLAATAFSVHKTCKLIYVAVLTDNFPEKYEIFLGA